MTRVLVDGRPVRVGDRIGRGGEGDVHRLDDCTGRALKLFHIPDAAREAKVVAMIGADLARACPSVAFPQAVARDASGRFVGFTMPLVRGARPVHELYGPASRRRHFPAADFRFLVRAAANVARAVARVHAAGVVIGDLNQSGVLVASDALATLIDADSFEFAGHRCRVGMPDYVPPELQEMDLGKVARNVQHDLFALAVLIFQLLFLGRHPMAGVPTGRDVPLDEAIRRHVFAHTLVRAVRLAPPPATPSLADLPPGVRAGFEVAFGPGLGPRLDAAGWAVELDGLEAGLATCVRDGRHHFPGSAAACGWCLVERRTGRRTFGTGTRAVAVAPVAGSAAMRHAGKRVAKADAMLVFSPAAPAPGGGCGPSRAVLTYLSERGERRVAVSRARAVAAGPGSANRFMVRLARAEARLDEAVAAWRARVGLPEVRCRAGLVREAMAALRSVVDGGSSLAEREERIERARIVAGRLRSMPVAGAAVPGLGARHRRTLAGLARLSVADLTAARLAAIPGLGSPVVAALLVWRDRMEAQIDRGLGLVPAFTPAELARRSSSRLAAAEAALRKAVKRLDESIAAAGLEMGRPRPEVDLASASRDHARADLRFLGFPVGKAADPARPAPVGRAGPSGANPGKRRARGAPRTCPDCGGALVARWAPAKASGASKKAQFLGCAAYPACTGSLSVRGKRWP